MPKRRNSEKIEHYQRKLQRLQDKERRRLQRVIESDSSDAENNSDQPLEILEEATSQCPDTHNEPNITNSEEVPVVVSELNPDVLAALGEAVADVPKFGPKIHENLSQLWMPILKKGMDKELKDKLLKQNPAPENCSLLQAPKLNPEILAAVSDSARFRDKRIETVQQQLGAGITALNKGLELLLENDNDRLIAVKHLSDSCRILCDLHFVETEARKKYVTPGLDKSFLTIIQEIDRDDMLFGNKLPEKIKASRAIEKQSLQIKKPAPAVKSAILAPQPSTSQYRPSGNWRGPPRYPSSNRGGRGGQKKTAPPSRRTAPAVPQAKTSTSTQFRQRVADQHP
ncbi:hypothetical protein ABMA28_005578 [Loxostege sticticalis]|uniref:Uncharacterized protein n=1 Tax=Loxostege sticticalis TaxID=481309 RepID=A0ABD0SM50_LOXSC